MPQEEPKKHTTTTNMPQEEPTNQEEQEAQKHTCDFCSDAKPLVYCRADSARLCLACDRHVHAANTVATRHPRSLLCNACASAASSIHCSSCRTVLCSNCDFDAHRGAGVQHDRRPVEGFTGCPSAAELVVVLGVGGDEKTVSECVVDEVSEYLVDDVQVWETPTVFSLDDLLVPTTVAHGFQAMGMPPLPKHRSSSCGKQKEELIRQIRELLRSENNEFHDGIFVDQATEFHHEVTTQSFQQGDLQLPASADSRWMVAPAYEDIMPEKNQSDLNEVKSPFSLAVPHVEYIESLSSMNPTLFNEPVEVHLTASTFIRDADNEVTVKEMIQPLPPKIGVELPPLDRSTVISRYKEKRKTRRFDKLIRYESRKIRADSRMRIKGRFAKVDYQ